MHPTMHPIMHPIMHRTLHSSALALAGLLALGCANRGHDGQAPAARIPAAEGSAATAGALAESPASTRRAIALSRKAHAVDMTEVVPDARGRSALTLDARGGVRLWPDLHAESVDVPLALPVHEPMWMSIARADTGFVAAFIDTAGAARVARIELDAKGDTARWIPLFETPPTDPLLELHVLQGGTRILALGVDHRVRMLDSSGAVRAELDRPGFVPWQLRVAEPEGAPGPVVLAVLAGPVRVQRIATSEDRLVLHGDAHGVALDRGPNRNDLELSPDGKTVLALMRRKTRSTRFELEAIDLATGSRRIVAADSDVKIRPRVHALAGTRVLLESGSGKGLELDVATGSVWPPEDGTPDRDALPVTAMAAVDLPGSSEHARMHAVVAGSLRLVPTHEGLVVDPLKDGGKDGGKARVLGRQIFAPTAVALDASGERVAWATASAIVIETLSGEPASRRIAAPKDLAALLAFIGDDRIVVMDTKGRVALHAITQGSDGGSEGVAIAEAQIPISWGIAASGFRPSEDAAGGEIVLSSLDPGEPVRVLPVTASGFGEVRAVAKAERTRWPEAGKPRNMGSSEFLAALGLPLSELRLRPIKVLLADPDPSGKRIALAQKTVSEDGIFDVIADEWIAGPEHFVVTIVDRSLHTREWSAPASDLTDIAWSADGTRVAITGSSGGLVLDAATGDTLLQR